MPNKDPKKRSEKSAIYYKNNKEKADMASAKWRHDHPEKHREQSKKWAAINPEKRAAYVRKSRYGLTPDQYSAMVSDQNSNCAICKAHYKLVVDHDHETGKVRGLLCHSCNRSLGGFKEDQAVLLQAIGYLQKRR